MNTKPGWLIVILISTVQLAFLLIAVLVAFSWLFDETVDVVGKQVCDDNCVIARQLTQSIQQAGIADIESPSSADFTRLMEILSTVRMPNNGFACVVDVATGSVITHNAGHPELAQAQFGDATLVTSDSQTPQPLIETVTQTNPPHQPTGKVRLAQGEHFVSANLLPGLDAILIVGQQQQHSAYGFMQTYSSSKQFIFCATMLIGFAGMTLIIGCLNRVSAKVEGISQGLENQVTERETELVKAQNAAIFGLAKLAESRDNDTGEHLDRIRSYVTILSNDLATRLPDFDDDLVHNLALASSLHDIGKVGIPDSILLKPGRLSKEEREVMELHTLIGGECLEAIHNRLGNNAFMHIAKQIAYYHHERWDGKGYPHGLVASNIPLAARIVAVADVYDALTSKRPYKDPLSHLESKSIILAGSGTQFDPEVVGAFTRHEEEFEAISRPQQLLSDDDVRSDFHVLCERAQASSTETESVPAT